MCEDGICAINCFIEGLNYRGAAEKKFTVVFRWAGEY